jgi:hypothetical protein
LAKSTASLFEPQRRRARREDGQKEFDLTTESTVETEKAGGPLERVRSRSALIFFSVTSVNSVVSF